jgi:Na+/H+ antiporter NhaD/arsenite permease-like protein
MAPKHKAWTAFVAFGVGALVAVFMGRSLEEYLPMALALLAGAGTAILLYRKHAVAKVA